jgi:hypothetical protein
VAEADVAVVEDSTEVAVEVFTEEAEVSMVAADSEGVEFTAAAVLVVDLAGLEADIADREVAHTEVHEVVITADAITAAAADTVAPAALAGSTEVVAALVALTAGAGSVDARAARSVRGRGTRTAVRE